MNKTYRRNAAVFIIVSIIWVIIDQEIKAYVKQFAFNEPIPNNDFGIFELIYVQNKGGAWGILSDSTYILGFISLLICAIILIYLYKEISSMSLLAIFSLALIFSGGIGNAIDRFTEGYVVDFIDLTFIDFPVFNIADIGITCGVVLFIISIFIKASQDRRDLHDKHLDPQKEDE